MKSLFFGIVLILLIGFGGFFYRNVAEHTGAPVSAVCTEEAKICPDGSTVGRTGSSCDFAPCLPPNIEISRVGISFVMPAGYNPIPSESTEGERIAGYLKMTPKGLPLNTINVYQYPIGEGETADEVVLAHTRYQPSDTQAENFERFETLLINGKQYRQTVLERFEGMVNSAFYLTREHDVLKFEIIEHDVLDWTNPELVVTNLPEHKALLELLSTVQSTF